MPWLMGIILSILMSAPALSATLGAAVIDDGYAGKVLEKIISAASALPDQAAEIRLSLDGEGKYLGCRTLRGSGSGICQAAKSAAPYGTPPYGVPVEILLTFQNSKGQPATTAKKQPEKTTEQANNPDYSKYFSRIRRDLRNAMYIPAKTQPGTYHATVRLKADASGKILESSIAKSSGDELLDKYVLQGIHRAVNIEAPPKGLQMPLELTFTLVR